MEIIDKTGETESLQTIDEAIAVVSKHQVVSMLKLPPDLAVMMPSIRRCLIELRTIRSSGGK